MQIVIDISEKEYEYAVDNGFLSLHGLTLGRIIKNGTPLPKRHGDLVSKKYIVDIIKQMPNDNPSYWNSCDVVNRQDLLNDIDDVPIIICCK